MPGRIIKIPKVAIFKAIAILSPFIILVIIEIILMITGYGFNYSLFIEDKNHAGFVYFNPNVSKKYFSIQQNATQGLYEPFSIKKKNNTYRIFVLGESTALGFPYHQSGSFHRMLAYRLQRLFPDKQIEIINLALTAINSYTIIDFSKQLPEYHPDAVLIYLGHNEYYGALGVGSTSSLGRNRHLIQTILFLRDFKIYQLLTNIIGHFKKPDPSLTDYNKTLMERMVSRQEIAFNSSLFHAGIEQFDKNLSRIFEIFDTYHIPVFCSNLVCNYRDQVPLRSSTPLNSDWNFYFNNASHYDSLGTADSAYFYYKKAVAADTTVAIGHFKLAASAFNLQKNDEARKEYILAKELDMLRFRAPEEINKIIGEKASKYKNVVLVDVKGVFEEHSPCAIIGKELITEHLHPNLDGYGLIAIAFYDVLKRANCIDEHWNNEISESDLKKELPVTRMDTLYGEYQIQMLKELWPFNEKRPAHDTTGLSFEEKLAGGLAVKTIDWEKAFNALFSYYKEQNRWREALKLFESQIPDMPFDNLRVYTMALQLAENSGDFKLAIYYGRKCFDISPGFDYAKSLFINYLKLDQPVDALHFIDLAIQNNSKQVNLNPLRQVVINIIEMQKTLKGGVADMQVNANIARQYIMIGNYDATRMYIEKMRLLQPDNKEINSLKKQLIQEGYKFL